MPSLLERTQLRSVGNSKIIQASILFPIIGYFILFNESAAAFLSTSRLDRASPNDGFIEVLDTKTVFPLLRTYVSWFGVTWLCDILSSHHKKYGDSSDYIRFDGSAMTQRMLRQIAGRARNPVARDTVTALFGLGFMLISVPSMVSAIKIGFLLFRPT
jgi:hypothetical protein